MKYGYLYLGITISLALLVIVVYIKSDSTKIQNTSYLFRSNNHKKVYTVSIQNTTIRLKVRNEKDPLGQGMIMIPAEFSCTKFKQTFPQSKRSLYQHELGQWAVLSGSDSLCNEINILRNAQMEINYNYTIIKVEKKQLINHFTKDKRKSFLSIVMSELCYYTNNYTLCRNNTIGIGGSTFLTTISISNMDETDTSVCRMTDHFNGIYTFLCPLVYVSLPSSLPSPTSSSAAVAVSIAYDITINLLDVLWNSYFVITRDSNNTAYCRQTRNMTVLTHTYHTHTPSTNTIPPTTTTTTLPSYRRDLCFTSSSTTTTSSSTNTNGRVIHRSSDMYGSWSGMNWSYQDCDLVPYTTATTTTDGIGSLLLTECLANKTIYMIGASHMRYTFDALLELQQVDLTGYTRKHSNTTIGNIRFLQVLFICDFIYLMRRTIEGHKEGLRLCNTCIYILQTGSWDFAFRSGLSSFIPDAVVLLSVLAQVPLEYRSR